MIKLGQVGCGRWGRNLVKAFSETQGCEVKWVADLSTAIQEQIEETFSKKTRAIADYRVILEDTEIEAVVIATPTPTHSPLTEIFLEAEKHVFVEKPLAMSSFDAQLLTRLAKKKNRVLMVNHLLLYHPAVEEMIKLVRAGDVGELYYVYSQRVNLGVIRTEENALWSFAPHDVAIALELFDDDPVCVEAWGGSYLQRAEAIEDVVFVSMEFAGGEMAHLQVSWLDPHKLRTFTVVGSDKMIVFDDMEAEEKLKIYDKGAVVDTEVPHLRSGATFSPDVGGVEPLGRACKHFVECVERGEKPRSDGQAGLRVIKVLERAQESLARRKE